MMIRTSIKDFLTILCSSMDEVASVSRLLERFKLSLPSLVASNRAIEPKGSIIVVYENGYVDRHNLFSSLSVEQGPHTQDCLRDAALIGRLRRISMNKFINEQKHNQKTYEQERTVRSVLP